MTRSFSFRSGRGLVPAFLALALWWLATRYGWVSETVLVPFEKLYQAALTPEIQQTLWVGLQLTFTRLLEGLALGSAGGLALGIGLGLSPTFDRLMGPSFHAVRQVAIFAWIPLLTAWFGNGNACKIIFVALAAFYPVVMGTYEGIRTVPQHYLEVGQVLCFSRKKMLRKIVLPSAAPAIVTALQLALIFSWFAAIGSEYAIGSISGGLGSVVMTAQENFRTDIVLLGVLLISALGILMNTTLRSIPRLLFRWKTAS